MLSREDYQMIQEKRNQGMYLEDIAHELKVSERTVRRALKRRSAPSRRRQKRESKLTAYHGEVDRMLSEGIWNARVILREIQAQGYLGSYTVLTDYIRPKRALRASKQTVRFETAPGQQMQHDWGELYTELGGEKSKVYINVNTLGYSRRFHVWAAPSLDAHHTYEGMIRSFEHFGGVPQQVLVDNQKAAVIEHRLGQMVKYHKRFIDMADHYGFTPKACRPYRARTKGKVERMVNYVKANFFVRYRRFEDWSHMNQLMEQWLKEEADLRIHGTHGEQVRLRFDRDEQAALQAIPPTRWDSSYYESRLVSWDAYVDVRGNRYSVPSANAGQPVSVRISLAGEIRLYDPQDQLIAEHRQVPASQGWQTVPEHHEALWQQTLNVQRRDLQCYEEAGTWN